MLSTLYTTFRYLQIVECISQEMFGNKIRKFTWRSFLTRNWKLHSVENDLKKVNRTRTIHWNVHLDEVLDEVWFIPFSFFSTSSNILVSSVLLKCRRLTFLEIYSPVYNNALDKCKVIAVKIHCFLKMSRLCVGDILRFSSAEFPTTNTQSVYYRYEKFTLLS